MAAITLDLRMPTRDEANWRETEHRRDDGGRFSTTGGGGGAAAEPPRSLRELREKAQRRQEGGADLHQVASILRPRPEDSQHAGNRQTTVRTLARVDAALRSPNPVEALRAIPIGRSFPRLEAYRTAMVRAQEGGARPAPAAAPAPAPTPPARPAQVSGMLRPDPSTYASPNLRRLTETSLRRVDAAAAIADPERRAAALRELPISAGVPRVRAYRDSLLAQGGAAAPAPAPRPAAPPARPAAPQPDQRAMAKAQKLRPNPDRWPIAAQHLPRIDEALRSPNPAAALRAIDLPFNAPRTRAYRDALVRAHGAQSTPVGSPMAAPRPAAPAPAAQTAAAQEARREYEAMGVPRRQYSPNTEQALRDHPRLRPLVDGFVAGFSPDTRIACEVQTNGASQRVIHRTGEGSTVIRDINWDTGEVYHAYQELRAQGGGTASKNLEASVLAYRAAGLKKVKVHAALSVGGYAWAKFGFVPNQGEWDSLRRNTQNRLSTSNVSERDKKALTAILNSSDPKALWALSDHPAGKQFLLGASWRGSLDLQDPASYNRCLNYARRRRSP